MFDVRVAEFLGSDGGLGIRGAMRIAAISDDFCVFIRRQIRREIVLDGRPAQRAWHMTGFVGIGTVRVNDYRRLGRGRRKDVGGADVGEFTRENRGGDKGRCEEGNDFFHGGYIV